MTLLARRREELKRDRASQEPEEKRRSAAVRPPQPHPSFLHVQAALGNRATYGLLRSGTSPAKRWGDPVLAQELSPVVQIARLLHTWEAVSTPSGFLVPDGTAPAAGQMTRSGFLAAMRDAAREAAEQGLAGTGHTARGCPWIEHYFHFYQRQTAERVEADLMRYVPAARGATSAGELLALASGHVQTSVRHWAATGELTGVPRGLPGAGLVGALAGSLAAVQAQLGEGRPLEASARGRMERAFGARFDDVRLHTGAAAARLARRFRARAFAVGPHVAFDHGEYRPGTLVGDAVLAHELAHTLQQRGADAPALHGASPVRRMEGEANTAAAGVLARLWGGARARAGGLAGHTLPRLRTGLVLARCRETFTDQELRTYLEHLKSTGIEGGLESDNKARAVVRENRARPGTFPLENIHVQRMIEEMLDGSTGGDDQEAILELLQQSNADRLLYLFTAGGLTSRRLLGKFSGNRERELRTFFEQRFEGGLRALQAGDVRPIPDADRVEHPLSTTDPTRGFRTEDLQRLRGRGESLTFSGSLSPLGADVQQLLLDNIAATVSFALDPANPDRVAELAALRQELQAQGNTGPFFETPAERIDATDLYHGHVCVPQAVLNNSSRLQELRAAASAFHDFGPGQSIDREIRDAIGHSGMPTTRPQARRVVAVVERHREPFLQALGPLLEAVRQVPEAAISYHTWEVAKPRIGSQRLPSAHPVRHLLTPFATQQPHFEREGRRDCATLLNFSFHVNRRGEITLLPGASAEMVRAVEILYGWEEGPAPQGTGPAPTSPPGGRP